MEAENLNKVIVAKYFIPRALAPKRGTSRVHARTVLSNPSPGGYRLAYLYAAKSR